MLVTYTESLEGSDDENDHELFSSIVNTAAVYREDDHDNSDAVECDIDEVQLITLIGSSPECDDEVSDKYEEDKTGFLIEFEDRHLRDDDDDLPHEYLRDFPPPGGEFEL